MSVSLVEPARVDNISAATLSPRFVWRALPASMSISRQGLRERSALFRSQQRNLRNMCSARNSRRSVLENLRDRRLNLGSLRESDFSLNRLTVEAPVPASWLYADILVP